MILDLDVHLFCSHLFGNLDAILKAFSRKRHPKEGSAKEESVEVDSNLRIPDSELRILWLESQDSHKLIGGQC